VHAPDFIEPVVGWRLWHVAERDGALRLVSPLYRTTWPTRRELVACCRRGMESGLSLYWPGIRRHPPPHPGCRCGIYGSQTPAQAAMYLSGFFKQREDVVHRVLGTVSLWGTVVECERGWRASHAYPRQIHVPATRRRRLSFLRGLRRPSLPAEEIALALTDYGVPVELVECGSIRELAEMLSCPASDLLVEPA